ncbi:MAG: hypothetical protein AAF387_20055 [Pseudomonadota bacterium]
MTTGKRHLLGDFLFYLQLIFALSMGISQAWTMLHSTEGIIVTWFMFWGIFLAINLTLSIQAHKTQPSRITKQTVIVYATWTVVMTLDTVIYLWKTPGTWKDVDTLTTILALLGIALTLVVGKLKNLPPLDPIIRGYLALIFKAMPQLTLAYSIWLDGGDGLSRVAVIVGHITICSRIAQIFLSLREASWDRNRIGSAISEIGNEVSLIVLTVVWLIR